MPKPISPAVLTKASAILRSLRAVGRQNGYPALAPVHGVTIRPAREGVALVIEGGAVAMSADDADRVAAALIAYAALHRALEAAAADDVPGFAPGSADGGETRRH